MKIYNNLEEFLEENEINDYTAEKIFTECSKFNPELANFLKDKHWKEIPLWFAISFIQHYQASEVNMITGKIIKPIESLATIPLVSFDYIRLKLKVYGDIECIFPPEIIIYELDEDDEINFVSTGSEMSSEYIQFEYDDEDEDFVENAYIDLNSIYPETEKMEIKVACSEENNFGIDKITLSVYINEYQVHEFDLTDEVLDEEGIYLLSLIWNVNSWIPQLIKR